jgi:ABC-type sugar transport system ATPase subunit
MKLALEMKGISKAFPGVNALQNVHFSVETGEVHCLIGANGAGKSTLMKILAGVHSRDQGTIFIDGKEVTITSTLDSKAKGLSIIYQELSLVEGLSLAENIFLGTYNEPKYGIVKWKRMNEKAKELFDLLKVKVSPTELVSDVSMGLKQITEIAKAIASGAKIIVMDEPSTALSSDEVENLFAVIKLLKRRGYTIIYISHKLDELYQIGDTVSVLRNGQLIKRKELSAISKEELIEYITGRSLKTEYKEKATVIRENILTIDNFYSDKLKGVSVSVGKGEIVGLYGLVGSGRTELLRAIYGADKIKSGDLYLNGKKVVVNSPEKAVKNKIGLVPENRKIEGLILDLSIKENAFLPSLNEYAKNKVLQKNKINQKLSEMVNKLKIIVNDFETEIKNLSGGNQQKVIISKWLIHDSNLLLFDEPTQGIDIGAKAEIYQIIKELADGGKSIIIASSEIEELLSICDRVLVMFEGKIIREYENPSEQKDAILSSAVSGL